MNNLTAAVGGQGASLDPTLADGRSTAAAGGTTGAMDPVSLRQQQLLRRHQEMLASSSGGVASAGPVPPGDGAAALLAARGDAGLARWHGAGGTVEAEIAARAHLAAAQLQAHHQALRAESTGHLVALQAQQSQQAARYGEIERLQLAALQATGQPLVGSLLPQVPQLPPAAVGGDPWLDAAAAAAIYGGAGAHASAGLITPVARAYQERLLAVDLEARQRQQQQQGQVAALLVAHQAALGRHAATGLAAAGHRGDLFAPSAVAGLPHLGPPLRLPHAAPDGDVLRRAAAIGSLRSEALRESLELHHRAGAPHSQLLVQQFLGQNGTLGPAFRAAELPHASEAVARELSALTGQPPDQIPHFPKQNSPSNGSHFDQGSKKDAEGEESGGHLSQKGSTSSTAPASGDANAAPPISRGLDPGPTADEGRASDFLAAVVREVPEIRPAVATLLQGGRDAALMIRRDFFPRVVDATLAGLEAIRDRNLRDGDDYDLHARVLRCIAAVAPTRAATSGSGAARPEAGTNQAERPEDDLDEDVPVMAAHRSVKRAAKKRKRANNSKKNRKPQLVHCPISDISEDTLDAEAVSTKTETRIKKAQVDSNYSSNLKSVTGPFPPGAVAGERLMPMEKYHDMDSETSISKGESAPISSSPTESDITQHNQGKN